MAEVILSDLWVHQVSNLANYVRVYMGSLNETTGGTGQVRRYANGVTRAITVVGTRRTVTVDLPFLARTDLATLEGWAGTPVMVRDPLGRKIFGMFFTVEVSESPIGDPTSVLSATFDLEALSLSEAV